MMPNGNVSSSRKEPTIGSGDFIMNEGSLNAKQLDCLIQKLLIEATKYGFGISTRYLDACVLCGRHPKRIVVFIPTCEEPFKSLEQAEVLGDLYKIFVYGLCSECARISGTSSLADDKILQLEKKKGGGKGIYWENYH